MYEVNVKKKVVKDLAKLPLPVVQKFRALLVYLEQQGPVLPFLPNYSKLSENTYHCHLSYHYVACWRCEKGT